MPRRLAPLLAAALAACVSQPITPAGLRELGSAGEQAAARLEHAVVLANAFLSSDARRTLPPGSLEWRGDQLAFAHAGGELELKIRRTTFGDLVESFGFEAQERSDGFVVGARGAGDPRLANSLFVSPSGGPKDARFIAELILHELTHTYCGDGTVSVCGSIAYYVEAILLRRYDDHSAERRPYATTGEFLGWARTTPAP
jgi:hypothetical protein